MTTPFGGQRSPTIIDLMPLYAVTWSAQNSVTITTTTAVAHSQYIDWSKFIGNGYVEIVWGHVASSTAGGNFTIWWRDLTNGVHLATSSTATSVDTTDLSSSTSVVYFSTFTKPSTKAQTVLWARNTDGTSRSVVILAARAYII